MSVNEREREKRKRNCERVSEAERKSRERGKVFAVERNGKSVCVLRDITDKLYV